MWSRGTVEVVPWLVDLCAMFLSHQSLGTPARKPFSWLFQNTLIFKIVIKELSVMGLTKPSRPFSVAREMQLECICVSGEPCGQGLHKEARGLFVSFWRKGGSLWTTQN